MRNSNATEHGRNTLAKIEQFHELLAGALDDIRHRMFPPEAKKEYTKKFTTGDLEKLIGVPESTLRTMSIQGRGPEPNRLVNNRRVYSIEQVTELRRFLAEERPADINRFLPHRREGEHTQIIAAVNFKGGSSKTTTCIHLTHYLALQGYRVLAVDLDPQASLTTTFGLMPEHDVGVNGTIYSAIRYDQERRPISEIVQQTYFPGIDIIPSNLEVQEFEFDTPMALSQQITDHYGIFFERLGATFEEIQDNYDIIVLDTPPTLGYLTLSALFAATGLIITVHPAMLDVASCSQFLKMMADTASVLAERGGKFEHDFVRILVTRYDPNDQPQKKLASMLRVLFGDYVLTSEALESTAVSAAGIARKSLYEIESGEVGREAMKRAMESANNVNSEILSVIHQQWGRTNEK